MPHQPSLKQGLKYWENQEASIDGVLGKLQFMWYSFHHLTIDQGGYGTGVCVSTY